MRELKSLLFFSICCMPLFLISCKSNKEKLFGKSFENGEVKSINLIKIDHPLFGEILEIDTLTMEQQIDFLAKLERLDYKGMYKCKSQYIIKINLEDDTLRLKVCENMVSNIDNDKYFALPNNELIIKTNNFE